MKLSHDLKHNLFIVYGATYDDQKHLGRDSARLIFDPKGTKTGTPKTWWTADAARVANLWEYADESCREYLEKLATGTNISVEMSRATAAEFDVEAPEGLEYFPFQKAGIRFICTRNHTLLGDPPGLGKTIEILGAMNVLTPKHVLGIVPASLKINWAREASKWLLDARTIYIVSSGDDEEKTTQAFTTDEPSLVIVNYDIVHKPLLFALVRSRNWDLLFCDEAHYLKNPKAERTIAVLGRERIPPKRSKYGRVSPEKPAVGPIEASRIVFATGTPIPNRPIEVQPLAGRLSAEFSKYWAFARRYCNSQPNSFGIDVSGSSNLHELQSRLRSTIMIRREKSEVLTELPAKIRQVIDLPQDGMARIIERERAATLRIKEVLENLRIKVELAKADPDPTQYREAVSQLSSGMMIAFTEMSKIRAETAIAKIPKVVSYVREMLDGGTDKIVVFAHHREVVDRITAEFEDVGSVKLYGGMSTKDKDLSVRRFQEDPNVRVFVGSMQAAGVGLTLHAASHGVFAEQDWVPGVICQAEDRLHRIGQLQSVLIVHLVIDGSIDSTMAKRTVEKQKIIDAGLDEDFASDPVLPLPEEAGTVTITRVRVEEDARTITEDQKFAILEGLRLLSGMCDGARLRDGCGFNGIDSRIGKSLAETGGLTPRQAALGRRLLVRYKSTQLPQELSSRIWNI